MGFALNSENTDIPHFPLTFGKCSEWPPLASTSSFHSFSHPTVRASALTASAGRHCPGEQPGSQRSTSAARVRVKPPDASIPARLSLKPLRTHSRGDCLR